MICGRDLQTTTEMTKEARVQCCSIHDVSGGENKLQKIKTCDFDPKYPQLLVDSIRVQETGWVLKVGHSDATSKATFLFNSSLDGMEKRQKQQTKNMI